VIARRDHPVADREDVADALRRLAVEPREEGPLPASVSRPGSVQRVNAVNEEMDEEAGALSW
jgi:hypothetical protein